MLTFDNSSLNLQSGISDEISTLIDRLDDSNNKPTKTEVKVLIHNQNALRYFKFHTDKYCALYRVLLNDINDQNELKSLLKADNAFPKAVRDKEPFYANFINIILPSLIELSHDMYNDVIILLQKCLFSSKEMECFLNDIFEKKKCLEKHKNCKLLFKNLALLYKNNNKSFELIYHSFCKSFKNFDFHYKMLIVLIEMIGFDLIDSFSFNKIKYQIEGLTLGESLIVLNGLLDVVIKLQTHLDCKINEINFSDFLKHLLLSVIALTKKPTFCCFDIILKIIEINPLIIESLINEILIYIMLNDNSKNLQKYEEVMIKIFQVFTKLHRIQNLISKMIPTLKSGLETDHSFVIIYKFRGYFDLKIFKNSKYNIMEILPQSVLDYFNECIINLASWQIINLFKTLLYHLNQAVCELNETNEETIFLEILSKLICSVLLSVRIAEHTVVPTTVSKFISGLDELKIILKKFGTSLLQKEHNHILMNAYLNICYYSAEISMTLEYYSINKDIKTEEKFTSDTLNSLHPYLSDTEWCLISERIKNFGGKPCKKLMQKLWIQKLRAISIFKDDNEDLLTPIIRILLLEFDIDLIDKFIVGKILNRLPASNLLELADGILQQLIDGNEDLIRQPHIHDCQLLTNGITSMIFTNLGKLFKQKRKIDDGNVKKSIFAKAINGLPQEMLLGDNLEQFLPKLVEMVTLETNQSIDLKIQENRISRFLHVLTKLPIIYSEELIQKTVILLLMLIIKDINNSNCVMEINLKCENLIIGIIQHKKFALIDSFAISDFLKLIKSFVRFEDLFSQIVQNIFKDNENIVKFEEGVKILKENLDDNKYFKLAVIVLRFLTKIKRVKAEAKDLVLKYKKEICAKMEIILIERKIEDDLIEVFALVLKIYLSKNENLTKLKIRLNDYLEYCLKNFSEKNSKGSLLLFITVLHNKFLLDDINFVKKIWDVVKITKIESSFFEEYSQLIVLITTLIPNQEFGDFLQDLLKLTEESINFGTVNQLKTWHCIVTANFNINKMNNLRVGLESLLEMLLKVSKNTENGDLIDEIGKFEILLIQTNHVQLTSTILDFLLLNPSILLTKTPPNFTLSISFLESLLKYRKPLIMDRLPSFLLQYRLLLKYLCIESIEIQKIVNYSHQFEMLTKSLSESTRDMSRIAMFLIADILGQYEVNTLHPNIKKHLNNCIYSLISLCDQHSVQYLMRVLSNPSTEMFKIMYEHYKKFYRFTGKI